MLTLYLSTIDSPEEKCKFERIYLDYRQTMFYTANSNLKDEMSAEDAVHQAFLRVIDHLDQIDLNARNRTKAFLVIITEHIAIDMYRKRKRENTIPYEEIEESYLQTEGIPSDEGKIVEAILHLPVVYSTVLRLKYAHGYSNIEIASILHISEENVRQRISRAKKQLAKALESEE